MSDKAKKIPRVGVKVTEVIDDINFDMPRELYAKIKYLRNISSKLLKADKFEREFVQKQMIGLREQCKNMIYKKWRLTVTSNRYYKYFEYDHFPKSEDIKHARDSLLSTIRSKRAEHKKMASERKEMMGFVYHTTGGVFLKPNSVTAIVSQVSPQNRISRTKKPHAKIKSNYIGVELEFVASCDARKLEEAFIKAGLAGFVQVKRDGSIRTEDDGREGQMGHEVVMLCRQDDIKHIITRVCTTLNNDKIKAFVNNSCGMHVHIDSRNRDVGMLFHNLVSALPMLKGMVPKCRTEGTHATQYCAMNVTKDMASRDGAPPSGRRYQAVNPESYDKYKTVEIRLHSGSLNAAKIVNWVAILTNIADLTTRLESNIENAKDYAKMFPSVPSKLIEYIEKRTETFAKQDSKAADTRGDHFWLTEYELAI